MKEIPIITNRRVVEHRPQFEIFNGNKEPHAETVERVLNIQRSLLQNGFTNINTTLVDGMPWVEQVHSAPYLDFLKRASQNEYLCKNGSEMQTLYPSVHPYVDKPKAYNPIAERGIYMFDTYTPIMLDTFDRAFEAASCAVTGAKLLAEGQKLVYVLTRPPGHHAEKAMAGGYCYLNNAAVATEYLVSQGSKKVAIFDFDLHHGNGTQHIFYDRPDVMFISIHASPAIKFPFYSGWEDESGEGKGRGYNYNFPLPEGMDNETYHKSVLKAKELLTQYDPEFLIVSAGFDTHEQDPIGAFKLTTDYYTRLGKEIAGLNKPVLTVQEGGYATEVLGDNVVAYLNGLLGK